MASSQPASEHPLPKKSRRPLKPRKNPENEINIKASNADETNTPALSCIPDIEKENQKAKTKVSHFEDQLQDMREKLEKLTLEKTQVETLLKEKDEALKQKDEEIKIQKKDQAKLRMEMKKLQKMKEFKPNMDLSFMKHDSNYNNKDKKTKKKMKKPCPPYILWFKEQWNQVKDEKPEAEFKEISVILGNKWKILSVDEKKPYEEKYKADKEAYLQVLRKENRENEAMKLLQEEQKEKAAVELLEQYLHFKQEADHQPDKKGKEKQSKDPLKPKQPQSAFFFYTNERRAALAADNKNILEIAKVAGEEWKAMTEEKRAKYNEAARKAKEQYMQEMELYKQKKKEEAAKTQEDEQQHMKVQKMEAMQLLKKKEKTEILIKEVRERRKQKKQQNKMDKDPNRPKKPATTFLLFNKVARKNLQQTNPGVGNKTLSALVSIQWKELDEAEKKDWNEKAAKETAVYKQAMEEYKKVESNKVIARSSQ